MARTKTDTVRVNSYIPTKLLHAAKALARQRGISYSEIMRSALLEYVRAESKKLAERKL